MSKVVLDSSAVLAFIQEESGSEQMANKMQRGIISAVNFCEIAGRLRD